MRKSLKLTAGTAMFAIGLVLVGCGETDTVADENTAVTDVDPGDAAGTIDDTTVIDGTIGAEEEMGMEAGDGDDAMTDGEDDMATPPADETAPVDNSADE